MNTRPSTVLKAVLNRLPVGKRWNKLLILNWESPEPTLTCWPIGPIWDKLPITLLIHGLHVLSLQPKVKFFLQTTTISGSVWWVVATLDESVLVCNNFLTSGVRPNRGAHGPEKWEAVFLQLVQSAINWMMDSGLSQFRTRIISDSPLRQKYYAFFPSLK